MFEIQRRHDDDAATSSIAIYASGGWQVTELDKTGRVAASTTRCFDRRTTATLRAAITQSPWETTILRIVCRAYSPSYTQYYVHGTLEYTARMCGAQRLDAESNRAIASIEATIASATPKPYATRP